MQNKIRKNKNPGFTIIETMIAVSLFIVIITTGMEALLNANLLQQKSQSMRSIMDSLSFIMEDMSKNLRTGYHYMCYDNNFPWNQAYAQTSNLNTSRSCNNGWMLVFEEVHGHTPLTPFPYADPYAIDQWAYLIGNISGKDGIFKSIDGGLNWVQLTPEEVSIDFNNSEFSVSGAKPPSLGDQQQPFVTIKLAGKITFKGVETPFSLQTSVSQRAIDR